MNSIGWLLVAILVLFIVIRRLVLSFGRQKVPAYMDPVVLLCGAWLVEAVAYSLPILVNRDPLEYRHVLYIALCHGCFVVGVMLVSPHHAKKGGSAGAASTGISLPLLIGIALVGFFGNFAIAYDGLSASSIGIMARITGSGLASVRQETVSAVVNLRGGPLASFESFGSASYIFIFLVCAGLVGAMGSVRRQVLFAIYAMAVVSFLIVSFNCLVIQGGRGNLMQLVVGIILASAMDPKRWLLGQIKRALGVAFRPVLVLTLVGVLASGWYFATDFMKDRTGTSTPLHAMASYHRTEAVPEVLELVSGSEKAQYALLSFSYLTVPLSTLGYYYDMGPSTFPGPFWGQYNFSGVTTFIMRRLGLLKYQRTMTEIRDEATTKLVIMGYGDNVWPTFLRDFAFDVGWAGVPAVMFVLGFLCERVMRAARSGDDFIMKIVALMTSLLLLFSIAHSLLILEAFQKVYWICLIIIVYQKIFGANGVFLARSKIDKLATQARA